jgi:AbrB family transcriptional regulator (stage V sporulation protein T)
MKATGIVRRVDDLGRVVIPKEIRRSLRIREGDPLELFTDKDGSIIFKKYSALETLENHAGDYAKSMADILNIGIIITDNDKVIAAPYKKCKGSNITPQLRDITECCSESMLSSNETTTNVIDIYDGDEEHYMSQIIVRILSSSEVIGSVILYSTKKLLDDKDLAIAKVAANFLGKQLEG